MILAEAERLLFIGDSITHAHKRPEEVHDCYRLGCGYVNHVAGSLGVMYPGLRLEFRNSGECGHGIGELADRWQTDCLEWCPDVVSVFIGVNDAKPEHQPPRMPDAFSQTYRRVLQWTRQVLPNVRLVLIEPFGLSVPSDPAVPVQVIGQQWLRNLRMLQPCVYDLAGEFGAIAVPLQDAFESACRQAPSRRGLGPPAH